MRKTMSLAFRLKTILISSICLTTQICAAQAFTLPGDGDQIASAVPNRDMATPDIGMSVSFVEPDKVIVQEPLLKALIQLNSNLSPYELDAQSQMPISFREALQIALDNSLPIKISKDKREAKRWAYKGSFGAFLPDISSGINAQELRGKFTSPFGILAPINSPFLTVPATLSWNFFKGGGILYGALQNKHNYIASQEELKGNINDVLYQTAKLYWQLALSDVLLQVRIKAVERSQAFYELNLGRYQHGYLTKLEVLQAETQISRDRQELIVQQVARRKAAVDLATALNLDPSVDFYLKDRLLSSTRLIDENVSIGNLLGMAVTNRPELKQYENLRLAAKDGVKVARAPLLPRIVGTAGAITTGADIYQTSAVQQSAAPAASFGVASAGITSLAPIGTSTSGPRKFTVTENFYYGINLVWFLNGMGVTDLANVQAAKWKAVQAGNDYKLQLTKVYQDVRNCYLDCLSTSGLLVETTKAINFGSEQIEVATKRLQQGLGTELDVLNAQHEYTTALVNKANAILNFNIAQAALLHAMGRISVDTLTPAMPLKS
jgi:outer membrane protein TolC